MTQQISSNVFAVAGGVYDAASDPTVGWEFVFPRLHPPPRCLRRLDHRALGAPFCSDKILLKMPRIKVSEYISQAASYPVCSTDVENSN